MLPTTAAVQWQTSMKWSNHRAVWGEQASPPMANVQYMYFFQGGPHGSFCPGLPTATRYAKQYKGLFYCTLLYVKDLFRVGQLRKLECQHSTAYIHPYIRRTACSAWPARGVRIGNRGGLNDSRNGRPVLLPDHAKPDWMLTCFLADVSSNALKSPA